MQQYNRTKVVFKDYCPNQILLLPPSLEEMIDPDHPVKVVNQVIDSQVVLLLVEQGTITLKEAYLDGTRIEANANRYTFVWGRSITKSKERIKKQLDELWAYAESVAREELENNEPDILVADAGYGSEENYEYLEKNDAEDAHSEKPVIKVRGIAR